MAQDRFYFWRGYYDAMEYLSDEEAGRLFRAICAYAFEGEEPDFGEDRLMQVAWTMVADSVAESVDMGRRSRKGGEKSGETRRNADKSKGVRKGVRKPLPKGVPKGDPNVEYGNVLSPSGDGERVRPRPAPDGAARPPLDGLRIPPMREGWQP